MAIASAEDWKKNMVGNKGNLRVVYPETTEIAEGVVYARYYAEGVVGMEGNVSPYRTRVTSVWVKESDGEWRVKSIHFSPANYGGTHKTQSSDFDD
jgi:ketosteroid isomerase-like protein